MTRERIGLFLSSMDNLRLAATAQEALKAQEYEVCSAIRDEIRMRVAEGRLWDFYYHAAQELGYTDNPLYDIAREYA